MASHRLLIMLTLLGGACSTAKHSDTVAVSGDACHEHCESQQRACVAACPDDVCRSDCRAAQSDCDARCNMPEDAGSPARVAEVTPPRPMLERTNPSGMNVDVDMDAGVSGTQGPNVGFAGVGGAQAGQGGAAVAGMNAAGTGGGAAGSGVAGTIGVAGSLAVPFAGNQGVGGFPEAGRGLPVAGIHVPIAGMRGPLAGDAP